MSYPQAVREGPFVKFDGWDVPGNDIGQYFKDLTGDAKITALKESTLQYGARFFAFNTGGWCKSWMTIDPSKFVRAGGSSLYVRVEYPGWAFYPGKDSVGSDIARLGVRGPTAVIQEVNKLTNPFDVNGFNTLGWIKSKIVLPVTNFNPNYQLAAFDGLYIRTSQAP